MSIDVWIDELKMAIILDSEDKIASLTQEVPISDDLKKLNRAEALLREAIALISKKRNMTREQLESISRSKKFLESDKISNVHRLLDFKL